MLCNELIYGISFFYIVIVNTFFNRIIVDKLWLKVKEEYNDPTPKTDSWLPAIVGVIDRILYLLSFLFAHPEFIAVWLTLKTVAKPKNWEQDSNNIPARAIFNIYIIGNGLCIINASAAYGFIIFMKGLFFPVNDLLAWIILGLPIILSVALYEWLRFYKPKSIKITMIKTPYVKRIFKKNHIIRIWIR